MAKKTRSHGIYYDSLETVIALADSIIEKYPDMTYKDFVIETERESYSDSEYPTLAYQTPETDEEKTERENYEKLAAERQAEYERKQYEQLKKKFENG